MASAAVQPPPPLPEALRPLLCRCHPAAPGLALQPPKVVSKRGRFVQVDAQRDPLRIVTGVEWDALLLRHSGLAPEPPTLSGGDGGSSISSDGAEALLRARIASLAELDPCVRGVRAVLRVSEVEQPDRSGSGGGKLADPLLAALAETGQLEACEV